MIDSDLIDRARAVPIADEVERRGIKLRGTVERSGPCPVCGGRDRFSINTRKGIWNCRGCSTGGDVVGLVQHIDGVGFREAVETLTGGRVERPHAAAAARVAKREHTKSADDHEQRQAAKAQYLWLQRYPIAGTLAERYLREARGYAGHLPATLGFLPAAKPTHHSAMIAAFALAGESEPGVLEDPHLVLSVHLTLLKPDGAGKADVKPNKLIIGRPCGLPITLAPPNDLLGLAITEGIEDALSVHQATGLGAWAAGAAGFMPALADAVPDYIECVTISAHADPAGESGARKLAEALARRGIEVRVEGLEGDR